MRIRGGWWMVLVVLAGGAQADTLPATASRLAPLPPQHTIQLAPVDIGKALAEDAAKDAPGPLRYAIGHAVAPQAGSVSRSGVWSVLPDGRHLWRLAVDAPRAIALDFGFDAFRLPHGAELWIVGEGKDNHIGPFTDADNRTRGSFWTPRVLGDGAELQLIVPSDKRRYLELELGTVHQAYRDVLDPHAFAKSGSCNVDVVCPEGEPWRDQANSVAVISFSESGTRNGLFCSGQFINSTGDPGDPLFLTANHCDVTPSNAGSLVAYLRFEHSVCRIPGSGDSGAIGDGPLALFVSGATFLAGTNPGAGLVGSDFTLVRFDAPVPPAADPYFTGWDRRDLAPGAAVGIHHPQGDEKRISFEDDPLAITEYFGGPGSGNTHLRVRDWDLGTTEPGSSGSGLWSLDHHLVGVLSGGQAACGNDLPDWYGRLAHAWDSGATANRRLRDWLDPGDTGVQVLDGTYACEPPALSLSSPAFSTAPQAGEVVTLTAAATGGGTFSFSWDLDDDGIADRTGTSSQLQVSWPTATTTQVRVTATTAEGCTASASRALDVAGPELVATAAPPQQLCGDNDASLEPGERWRLPLSLRNEGDASFASSGRALFAPPATVVPPIGPDDYGYTASTSDTGACAFEFVDIASGGNAVAPFTLTPASSFAADDEGRSPPIALQPGTRIYGNPVDEAVMSTNGYVAFDAGESGGDFTVECPLDAPDRGSVAPRLHVLHDDLEVQPGGGLRHRWFANCPRPADTGAAGGCHVFQWDDASIIGETTTFDFQALLYPGNDQLVYQYRSAPPDGGGFASIGLIASPTGPQLSVSCQQSGVVEAGQAVCIFDKDAQPGGAAAGTLRLETPAPALVTLAADATTSLAVDLFIPAGASCGAPLAVDFLGAANATQSAPADQRVLDTTVGGGQSCDVSSCSAQVPVVDARYGLFYQHARSGNGLLNFVYDQPGDEDIYGAVWYTARPDRSPQWYTVQGPHAGNLGQAGIYRFTNTAAPGGFAPEPEQVGQAWIAQPAHDDVVFAWRFDDGRAGIELLHSAGVPFASPNRTQQWYQPAESGWGAGVESNQLPGGGYNEFWATFLYDDTGDGRWVVGSTGQREGSVPLIAYQVHCPGCPRLADALQRPEPAGSLSRTWPALDRGLLDTDILLPSPLSGSWLRDDLPIVPLGPVEQP